MKILHVNTGTSGGGVEQYLSQIFLELSKKGHQNFLLYGQDDHINMTIPGDELLYVEGITSLHCHKQKAKLKVIDSSPEYYNDPDIDYFELTINGCIPFDEEHPLYNNSDFFEQLLQHYQDVENYEMCGTLLKRKKAIK